MESQVIQNFDEWIKEKAFAGNHYWYDSGDVIRFYTGVPHKDFNYLYKLDTESKSIVSSLEQSVEFFKGRDIPFMLCQEASKLEAIKPTLKDMGFHSPQSAKGLTYDLTNLPDFANEVPGLEISIVNSDSKLRQWVEINAESFGYSSREGMEIFQSLFNEQSRSRFVLAHLDEKPVGAAMILLGSEAVGLYWSGVIPEASNQKIEEALVKARLQMAQEHGYATAVAQCFDSSLDLYKRLGFKEQCVIDFYRHTAVE